MYEFLEGDLVDKSPSRIVLGVQGVGYVLAIPVSTYGKLPQRGRIKVLTHLHTNEEGPRLFGFASSDERDLFRLLLTVSGVGPSTALSLLSQFTAQDLAAAVNAEDSDRLRQVKGVGEKTAKRIVLELKEKFAKLGLDADKTSTIYPPVILDAVSALVSIGFERKEAENSVLKAQKKLGTQNFEELVKAAISAANS